MFTTILQPSNFLLTFQADLAVSILVHFVDFVDHSVDLFQKHSFKLCGGDVSTAVSVDLLEKLSGFVTLLTKIGYY